MSETTAAASLTPVGDYLRRRYPPNDGVTHWLGQDGDPGCEGGGHPPCVYHAAWREALSSLAADLETRFAVTERTTEFDGLAVAIRMARERAGDQP